MKKRFTLSTILAAALAASAQVSPSWVRFPAPSNYQNYDVLEVSAGTDSIGNIYTAASVSDTSGNFSKAMLVKHNSAGTQLWIKYVGTVTDPAYAVSVLVDKAGNSYVCGYAHVTSNSLDFAVIKYDNAGTQLWMKTWDGGQQTRDYLSAATFDHSGNIIVAGNANFQGSSQYDMAVVKYSTAGTQLATYLYNNSAVNLDDVVRSVACDASDNIFITGHSYGAQGREMTTIKLNSSAAMQWVRSVTNASSNDESGYSVVADIAGNSYVTGATGDWTTIKYDPAGTVLWANHYTQNGLNSSNLKKVMLDQHSDVIVAGDAFFSGGHFSDLVISKLSNATGTQLWSASYNFGGIDAFRSAALDTMGNVYACAHHEGSQGSDITALAVTALGVPSWTTTYTSPSPVTGTDDAYGVVLDKDRNMILVGTSETRGSASTDAVDVIVLKYNAVSVGMQERSLPEPSLSLFPNPCNDRFFIQAEDQTLDGARISVVTPAGQLVLETSLDGDRSEIATARLSKGLYFITVSKGGKSAVRKLIVQ